MTTISEAMAEAIRISIIPLEGTSSHQQQSEEAKEEFCTRLLLPSDGPNQKYWRDYYSQEVLYKIKKIEVEDEQSEGFAIGVPTGLERGLGWKGAVCVNMIRLSLYFLCVDES
jgi:hypothetical protein